MLPKGVPYRFSSEVSGPEYLLAAVGPEHTVAAGATATIHQTLFVGPMLHAQLEKIDPSLKYVVGYGYLTILAGPLFWLLSEVYAITGNWGVAIILVTFLLKLLLYPLSEASGRSMAKMKALGPRIKNIQETYKDDKEKLGRAMMEHLQAREGQPGLRLPAHGRADPGVPRLLLGAALQRGDAPGAVRLLDPGPLGARSLLHPARHHGGRHVRAVQAESHLAGSRRRRRS